jgi:hypothetical protein
VHFACHQTSTNSSLFANGIQFNSSSKSKVLHTELVYDDMVTFCIKFHVFPPWQYTRTARRSPGRTLPNSPFACCLPTWILHVLLLFKAPGYEAGGDLTVFQLKCSSNIDSIHYLRLTNSFHQVPRDIHTLPVKEPIPRIW